MLFLVLQLDFEVYIGPEAIDRWRGKGDRLRSQKCLSTEQRTSSYVPSVVFAEIEGERCRSIVRFNQLCAGTISYTQRDAVYAVGKVFIVRSW